MRKHKSGEYSTNRQLVINLSASFCAYMVTFGINFFLSPYIVKSVGVEAYGFVGLANNFISYATLITIALNSLAGRFITVRIHERDYEGANRYYSSVFLSNCFISFFLLIILTVIWVYLEQIINIPSNIFWDVKILFAALFLNCLISTIGSVFGVATFATNKLYLGSFRTIESSIIRAAVLIALFVFCAPKVSYLGITALLTGVYCLGFNIYYMGKLLPFIQIKRSSFDIAAVKELISSGIWSLITRIGQIFSDGLDLLVTNLFIDAAAMGTLALAKTVPSIISGIVGSIVGVFSPNFTILYAENKMDELVQAVRQSMKIMGVFANLPIIVLIVCGRPFYALWQPTQDPNVLYVLSLLTCGGLIFNGAINAIYNIFVVVNKMRFNAIALLVASMLSTAIVFFALQRTDAGVYAVAGVSTVVLTIKNVFLIVPYAAKCLHLRWYVFLGEVIRSVLYVALSSAVCGWTISFINVGGWCDLIICSMITGVISLLLGLFLVFSASDRNILIHRYVKKMGN